LNVNGHENDTKEIVVHGRRHDGHDGHDELSLLTILAPFNLNRFYFKRYSTTGSKRSKFYSVSAVDKTAATTVVITIGTKVDLTGLSAATDLNGCSGVVIAELNAEGRYGVRLDNGKGVNLKAANIIVHSP
jgi:hypothetical protein